MTRNTLRRVEVAAPIYDEQLKLIIREMFITMLSDNVLARIEQADGNYKREEVVETPLNSQEYFIEEAYAATRME